MKREIAWRRDSLRFKYISLARVRGFGGYESPLNQSFRQAALADPGVADEQDLCVCVLNLIWNQSGWCDIRRLRGGDVRDIPHPAEAVERCGESEIACGVEGDAHDAG